MKNKICVLSICLLILSSVLCFAEESRFKKGPNPDFIFDFIAKDLKLTDEQKTTLNEIKSNLEKCHKDSRNANFEEFKLLVSLVEKGNVSEEDINSYQDKSFQNDVNYHYNIAIQMRDFYNILDNTQKQLFVDKMTFKPNKKGKHDFKKGNHKKDFHHRGQSCDCDMRGKFEDKHHNHKNGRPPFDKHAPFDKHGRFDNHAPFNHRMHKNVDLNKQNLLRQEYAFELNLDKQQLESYMKIKDDVRKKRFELFTKDDFKKDNKFYQFMAEITDSEQLKANIVENLKKLEECNLFMLNKYFEFVSILKPEQKEVLLLKYKYDIARINLRNNNDK